MEFRAQGVPEEAFGPEDKGLLEDLGFLDEWLNHFAFLREHPALQALLILIGTFFLAKLVDWVVTRVLGRLAQRSEILFDDTLVELIHRPLVRSTVLVGASIAVRRLALEEPWDTWTVRFLMSLALLVWVPFTFRAVNLILRTATDEKNRYQSLEARTFPLFDNLSKLLLFGGFTYLFIRVWGADATGLIASAGIMGLAIGFAAQDTLANLFAGVFIIIDSPFAVGDFVHLDSGERGQVVNIGLRSTRLLTRDDIEITIPNSLMGQAKILNEAGGPSPKHRLRVRVGVSYDSDIDQVREVLMRIAAEDEYACDEPAPRVRFRTFGDSGLDYELLVWIEEPVLRGRALDSLNCAVFKRFREEGIEIPYPKRDVYVRTLPGEGSA